ncbi:eryA [Symbiodinium sp. KB8]|nr:eryA [Symbiodinium sp. KB8]
MDVHLFHLGAKKTLQLWAFAYASIADVGLAMEQEAQASASQAVPPIPLPKPGPSEDGGGVFVKYKVHESSTGADPSVEVKLEPLWRRSTLVDLAKDAVADILQVQATAVKPDRPLMDLGFDSAGALKLRNKLSRRLKIELPPTLLFDHPTINDMVDNGIALLSKRPMTPAHADGVPATTQQGPISHHVIVSTSCQFPGGANSLKLYWDMLADKTDAVIEVPLSRWDHELYYSQEPQEGKTYARHGGFVEGTDLFDVTYFGLGSAEARTTDPQQRMLLGAAYDALRGDGYDKALLQNNPLGVFTALSNMEWFHLAVSKPGVYTGPGVSSAIAANRISYVFGLKGPSMTALA